MSDRLEIVPLTTPPDATVRVPGSKSITNRALVLAALASNVQVCELQGALHSEDTEVMVQCLQKLGFDVRAEWAEALVHIGRRDDGALIPARQADLFVGNSGTTMRFLTALVGLGHGRYRLDGIARMRERPIEDLLDALRQLGVRAYSEKGNGCPPVVVESGGLQKEYARLKGDISSQFLSALLMSTFFAREDMIIQVDGPVVSEPYINMTLAMMSQWGFRIAVRSSAWTPGIIRIEPDTDRTYMNAGQPNLAERFCYEIEPDASAASYFFAAAAITGGRATVLGLPENSLQGDVSFVGLLEQMGCRAEPQTTGITVHGGPLRGIDVDMNDISDTVMTLAAVALFADSPTTIRNVAHIRHKETDRLAALATELRRVGAEVEEFADGLRITPRPLHAAEVETYNDHRMAMSMALVGLKVPGVVIKDPGCVVKTYPNFFSDLEKLRDADSPR